MPDWQRLPWRVTHVDAPRLGSRLRRRYALLTHRHADVTIHPTASLGPRFRLWIPGRGRLVIGPRVVIRRGFTCEVAGDGVVDIGAGTVFTENAMIQCTTSITIGEGAVFSQDVLLVDGSHRFRDSSLPMTQQGYDYQAVRIGAGVSVMAKCSVIGATIGDGAFIGAHSLVTRDIPPHCLAVGVPAQVREYFGPPELRPVGLPDTV